MKEHEVRTVYELYINYKLEIVQETVGIKFDWAATDHTIRDLFMYASQTWQKI